MKISKNEKQLERYVNDGIVTHIVTRNLIGKYTLYKVEENDYIKIKTSDNPTEFDSIAIQKGKQ